MTFVIASVRAHPEAQSNNSRLGFGTGLQGNACDAIKSGEMKQQDLVDRVTRSFTLLMDAGLFDPLEEQQYLLLELTQSLCTAIT